MRTTMVLMAVAATGCVASDEHATTQAVAAPAVSVVERAPGELAVSWTADPLAVRYLVYQSAGGALPALVATVLDSGGGAPATSWIATDLSGGVEYCYSIRAVFADGGVAAPGGGACATVDDAAPSTRAVRFFPRVIANDGSWSQSDGFGVPRLVSSGTSTTGLYLEIPYERDEQIVGMTVDVKGNGSAVASFSVTSEIYNAPITGSSVLALVTDTGRSGAAWSTLALTPFTPRALTGDRFLYLAVTQSAAGYAIGAIEAVFQARAMR